jgi:hypothetical protein
VQHTLLLPYFKMDAHYAGQIGGGGDSEETAAATCHQASYASTRYLLISQTESVWGAEESPQRWVFGRYEDLFD